MLIMDPVTSAALRALCDLLVRIRAAKLVSEVFDDVFPVDTSDRPF
jgi:hypothetical protein